MFAVVTHGTREPFSFGGRILLHASRPELEWLIPTHPVVELNGDSAEAVAARLGVPTMLWKDHPDMAGIRWPLDRKDFVT